MLDSLRFVASAVAKKDYVPELTHYRIKDGRVMGFNGVIGLCSDINVDLDVLPNAQTFLHAIRACKETIALNVTPAGKLAVKSGNFRSFVNCLPDDAPQYFVEPDGEEIEVGEGFLQGVKAMAPFVGIDASRPWAQGIRLSGGSMFATNNVLLAEYWHGTQLPFDIVIPSAAVDELLRINSEPTRVQMTDRSITFWFSETKWLRSALVEGSQWPHEMAQRILDGVKNADLKPFDDGFFEAVATLKPFLSETRSIFLSTTGVSTSREDGDGTRIDMNLPQFEAMQRYSFDSLMLLGEIATAIDWGSYPRPCIFTAEGLRGAIIGQKVDL